MIWVRIFTVNRIIMHYDDLVLRLYGPTLNGVIVCAAASGCESLLMVGFPRALMRMCSRGLVAMAPLGVVCFLSAHTKGNRSLTLVRNLWQRLMESLYVWRMCMSVCVCGGCLMIWCVNNEYETSCNVCNAELSICAGLLFRSLCQSALF